MDNPNITMEEYIRLEEEKARRRSIVFNDTLTSEATLSCEPTVSSLNNDEIDFKISFDECDDEDCTHSYSNDNTSFSIDVIDKILEEDFNALLDEGSKIFHSIEGTLLEEEIFFKFNEFMAMTADENSDSESDTEEPPFEKIIIDNNYKIKTSLEEPPMDLELKPLPDNLDYVFLEEPSFLPVIISSQLSAQKKSKLVSVLKKTKTSLCLEKQQTFLDAHLVLNWEKCHFMVKEGIVLGHKVCSVGLKVDKAKIDVILKLPPPTNIKGIRSFLRHAGFYRRFIKDFSKVARPLTKLLEKDTPFKFSDECQKAFELLEEKLTCAPVVISQNWILLFELMCDVSDFAVGAVLDFGEESTIPLNEIISQIPSSIAITPILPTLEPEDSLFMEKSVTFSNPLFDSNDDFTSSNDESLSDEDVPEDNVKIYSNPLFEFDDEYISSDINPLFDEVLENIESKDSYVSNIDESALLVTPLSDFNEDKCFNPGGDVDEIEFLLHRDPSTPKLSVASILEGFTNEPPLEENDDLFDLESKENEWKKILYDAPIDDLMTEDKVFDPGIHEKTFSPTYVSLPFEDRHYLSLTYVIQIFLPYFTYPVDSSLPLSSGSEDIIFDPGISAFHFSSLEPVAYECPMEDCPDYEDSRARGFVHRSLDLQSFACLYMGIRYPRSY
ncbi:reverse transcriptase domain-containing protein [Tanacetum coccineum]